MNNSILILTDGLVGFRCTADVVCTHHNMWGIDSTSISNCDVITNNSARICSINYSKSRLGVGKSGYGTRTITNLCPNSGESDRYFSHIFFIIFNASTCVSLSTVFYGKPFLCQCKNSFCIVCFR